MRPPASQAGAVIIPTPELDAAAARALTDRIRGSLVAAHDGLVAAFQGRAWTALDYPSWDAYCAAEFAAARMVRLDREQRREIVAELRAAGMSTRAIASGLGAPQRTIADDVARLSETAQSAPRTVTSLDGHRRPATRPPREIVRQAQAPREEETRLVRRIDPTVTAGRDRAVLKVAGDIALEASRLAQRSVDLWGHDALAGTSAEVRAAAAAAHRRIAELHLLVAELAETTASDEGIATPRGEQS